MRLWSIFSLLLVAATCRVHGQPRLLDAFEHLDGWTVICSDGATGEVRSLPGIKGSALDIQYSFHGGSGYVIAQKHCALELSPDYRFTFFMRGEGPLNNFEFKLLDTAGNVYRVRKPDVEFPRRWKRTTVKRRHVAYAWGPAHGGEIRHVDRIELVVSAGTGGGSGSLLIDELSYKPIDTARPAHPPLIHTSSGTSPAMAKGTSDSIPCWALPRERPWR